MKRPVSKPILGLRTVAAAAPAAVLAVALAFSMSSAAWAMGEAASPTPQQVDAYVEAGMKQLHAPGAAVALFSQGRITHLAGFGRTGTGRGDDATGDAGAPVTPQTPFQLGSVSKSFTALIVLQLADEGRIALDDPVSNYLPSFRTRDRSASDRITIRQLLNHRSGLSALDGNRNQATTYRGADAMARAVARLKDARLGAAPGRRFEYSNANYVVLADLIETVDHRPYERAVEARIFSPLGMKNSFVQTPKPGSARPALGHTQWFGHTVERDFVAGRMMAGPGGITASAEDLATYLIAVFEHDPRIVPASLTEALTKDRRGGYVFGWEFGAFGDRRLIFHGGLNPGFWSRVAYDPQTRQGVVVLSNMSGSLEGNLVGGAVNQALGLPAEPIAPSSVNLLRLWGGLALTIALLLGLLGSIRGMFRRRSERPTRGRAAIVAISSAALIGLSYVLVIVVPGLSGVDLTAVYMFYPDVGVLLFVSALIASLWAGLRLAGLAVRLWLVRVA